MMTDNDLERLREQGPTPGIPSIHAVMGRANEMKRRARWQRLTVLAAISVVIVAGVLAEPWNSHTQPGVAGADVLAALGANPGCGGTGRRATPAEADAVRFLPAYVPAGFRIDDAYTNHLTESACFSFVTRAVYTSRTGSNSVGATLTISTGSEPVVRVDCGSAIPPAPKPVDAPASDGQRCVQVRGHVGELVRVLGTTSVVWIEPDVGAVSVHATALTPETLIAFANALMSPADGRITAPDAAVPAGYSLAYENWDPFQSLTDHNDFRGEFTQGLWITVSPSRRSLWDELPLEGGFDLVDIQGHQGIESADGGGGLSVLWKVGDNLFSVNAPPGVTRADALRIAQSFAPVPRDDPRLIDPSTRP
jgi:hypothetical protein